MIQIDLSSPVPLYDQIKAGLRGLVAKGLLKPGDDAPSIRSLAARLKVNPNTVARAYRELTMEGFFEARRGEGNVISPAAVEAARGGLKDLRQGVAEAARMARRGGVSWPDILSSVDKVRKEES
ncbi:MAG: GntR family transcriptional regulator [Elusimicrobia bacterium]|nr:GntR family transcriptional regulator [Elusimicrobiota bacterium]